MALASTARLSGRRGAATWAQSFPQLTARLSTSPSVPLSPPFPLLESGRHSPSSSSSSPEAPPHFPSLTSAPLAFFSSYSTASWHSGRSAYSTWSAYSAVSGYSDSRAYSWHSCQLLGGIRGLSSGAGSQVVAVQTVAEFQSTISGHTHTHTHTHTLTHMRTHTLTH